MKIDVDWSIQDSEVLFCTRCDQYVNPCVGHRHNVFKKIKKGQNENGKKKTSVWKIVLTIYLILGFAPAISWLIIASQNNNESMIIAAAVIISLVAVVGIAYGIYVFWLHRHKFYFCPHCKVRIVENIDYHEKTDERFIAREKAYKKEMTKAEFEAKKEIIQDMNHEDIAILKELDAKKEYVAMSVDQPNYIENKKRKNPIEAIEAKAKEGKDSNIEVIEINKKD